jgi:hypothetical protein
VIRRFFAAFAPLPLLLALALAAALSTFWLLVATFTHGRAAEIPLPPPPGFGAVPVPAGHVFVIVYGVNDDGATWRPRFKRECPLKAEEMRCKQRRPVVMSSHPPCMKATA